MKHRERRCPCCSKERFILSFFVWFSLFIGVTKDQFDHWTWELTPMPLGFPSFRQYMTGLRFFLTGKIIEY